MSARTTAEALLARRLAEIVGADAVVADRRELRLYRGGPWSPPDPAGRFGQTPALAVKPGDGQQVAACLATIVGAGRPAVALGGGTGLTGGASPSADSVVVDLARLDGPIEVDRASRRATVGAAVKLGDLAVAAEEAGLLFAHDPWSQPIASVGGAIATNGVGYLAAGYGAMGAQVLGLEVALTTGELARLPAAPTSSAGPDLSRLFVGSEGTLGVVTSAVVRLFPLPERRVFRSYRFATFGDGYGAIQAIIDAGIRPCVVDYEEEDEGPASMLFVAVDGIAGAVEAAVARVEELVLAHGGAPQPERAAATFWRGRHDSAKRYVGQLATWREELLAAAADPPPPRWRSGWRYMHLAVPAGRTLGMLERAREIARQYRVGLSNAGIWGAPELLSFVLDGSRRTTEAAEEIQLAAAAEGGSIEYCHGVGLRLAHLLPHALGPAFPMLRRIKDALDPSGRLNPGKQGLGAM